MNKSSLANKVKENLRESKPESGPKKLGDKKPRSTVKNVNPNEGKDSGRKD